MNARLRHDEELDDVAWQAALDAHATKAADQFPEFLEDVIDDRVGRGLHAALSGEQLPEYCRPALQRLLALNGHHRRKVEAEYEQMGVPLSE